MVHGFVPWLEVQQPHCGKSELRVARNPCLPGTKIQNFPLAKGAERLNTMVEIVTTNVLVPADFVYCKFACAGDGKSGVCNCNRPQLN